MQTGRIAGWAGCAALGMAAAGLAGCAALQPSPGKDTTVVAQAAAQAPPAQAAPPSAWGKALQAKGCTLPDPAVGDRLEQLQRELEPLGLEPRLQGCVSLAGSEPGPALVLDAWVTDGRKAMAVVRGPLADGEALDLGLEAGLQAAGQQKAGLQKVGLRPMPDDQVSPDVQFNRRWWQGRLGAYGLQAVPGQVRTFVPTP
ncbi:hypothetical protein [Delftia sp. RIT313]|uniref:hypothetical protein n=1 Tax=Delftia sp. RIT313 TaxID=1468410 RepID=UPI000453425D|nr:hypothetical protein [Delftia sp. RIT313]EZP48583.1 Hypothetical protein precursor [Delftia sp. RIT313]